MQIQESFKSHLNVLTLPYINATPQVGKPSQSHHTELDQAEVQMRFESYRGGKDFNETGVGKNII